MLTTAIRKFSIGKNNFISKTAKIFENVKIGDNNYIGDNVTLYPGVEIGNHNIIYPNNVIGEVPVSSNDMYKSYSFDHCKGVQIGDHNLFHVSNLIFSGLENKTFIGNHNKFLAENHMGHDTVVKNNVTFYPRVIQGGHSVFLDFSNVGMGAMVQQRKVVGQYAMLGGCNMYSKDVYPFFICIAGKIVRLNSQKLSKEIVDHESLLRLHYDQFTQKNYEIDSKLPESIRDTLSAFYAYFKK
jgi:UDP-N-acetylglucosamine acyltransferase